MTQNSNIEDNPINVKDLFFSLITQWKVIALCVVISLICALLYLRVTPPTFSTDAMVQVEDSKGAGSAALLGTLKDSIPGAIGGKSPADAEIEILNSRMILGQAIKDLNLDIQIEDHENSFFNRLISKKPAEISYNKNLIIVTKGGSELVIKQFDIPKYYQDKSLLLSFSNAQQFELSYEDEVIFKGKLNQLNTVNDQAGTWKIEFLNKVPFKQSFQIKKLSEPTAIKFIQDHYYVAEKGKLSGVLGLSYNGFDKEHITQVLNHILMIYHTQNIERKSLESKQTLSFLDKQLPELKKQLEDSEIKFNQFREKYNTVDVTQESELMLKQNVELAKMKIELQQQQAELSSKYTSNHPLMAAINAQLAEINKKTNEMTQSLKQLPETQRQYLQLYRDVKVNSELYTTLLNSYQQLKIAEAGEIGNIRIIDQAIEPVKPIKPRTLMTLALALFAGGFIGTLIALLRSFLKSGIKDSSDIENVLGLPVYSTVPKSIIQESRLRSFRKQKRIPILAISNSDDIAIESLRSMRTAIHFALSQAPNNIIMISGPAPEVGKSFISTNLAVILAKINKKVLIIDADLRRGYLHKYFAKDNKAGLSNYLTGQQNLDSIIQESEVSNLSVITRGPVPSNPSELLGTQRFEDMLKELSTKFDHILIDTPPVLAVTDGVIISQLAGVNLVIARYGKTQMKELELTVNRFEQAGVKVNGFILNDVQNVNGRYAYGYNYSYAYKAQKSND